MASGAPRTTFPAALVGFGCIGLALTGYSLAVVVTPVLRILDVSIAIPQYVVWYCGIPLLIGFLLVALDAVFLAPRRRNHRQLLVDPVSNPMMTVVLTAYNDELSIGEAVADFIDHPLAQRVIVVDNNSSDRTAEVAREAGAIVVVETKPGYGKCVYRALTEGASYTDTHLVALCEGDMTFRAADLEKFLSYSPHADVVNGTRIVEQLRSPITQLTSFMYYGNFAVAKLLEFKHLGKGTITDVGTTYKVCRSEFLREHLAMFDPRVNLEFNAHFLDTLLGSEFRLVECPITFYPRVGESKGGNTSNRRATKVGVKMIFGMLLSWRLVREKS